MSFHIFKEYFEENFIENEISKIIFSFKVNSTFLPIGYYKHFIFNWCRGLVKKILREIIDSR